VPDATVNLVAGAGEKQVAGQARGASVGWVVRGRPATVLLLAMRL